MFEMPFLGNRGEMMHIGTSFTTTAQSWITKMLKENKFSLVRNLLSFLNPFLRGLVHKYIFFN